MSESQIPLYLVSGFLGSGKSSFLKNILEKIGDKKRIGIVQNEFSSINVDSRTLAQTGRKFSIMEVNRGSVFCLCLLNDFIPSLAHFIDEQQPEAIFIEASGLSDPVAILQMVNSPLLSQKVRFSKAYTIIDCFLFDRQINMLKSVSNQIKVADTVLINKCDKMDRQNYLLVGDKVKEYNPFCDVHYTQFAVMPDSEMEIILGNAASAQALSNLNPSDCKPLSSPPDIKVEALSTPERITEENLYKLTELLKPLLRAKGFVRMKDGTGKAIQAVSGDISIQEYPLNILRSEMVFFGEEINMSAMNNLFMT